MPHFKVQYFAGFGENETIVETEDAEAAEAKVLAELEEDGRFGEVKIVSAEPYTPTYGQTVIMGTSTGGYGGVFGYGDDLATAKVGFRKNGGALKKGYSVYVFDAETDFLGVTNMGAVRFMGGQPTVTEVAAR